MAKKAVATKKRQRSMSDQHKAALAEGREQGRVIRRYLEALESHRPKRGRKRTPETISKRLAAIDERMVSAGPLNRLQVVQERMDLERELTAAGGDDGNLEQLEGEFVSVTAAYGNRKGITYDAWRAVGVKPSVLSAAGIGRGQ